ncbi:MAG: hypothetical protein KDJ33_18890 [Gammaproteobacteria bacterium]|nr:hypothetical protein [Gammaproteobacteria bacterium]
MREMTLTQLRDDLRMLLGDCASKFAPEQLELLLNDAAEDLARHKPTLRRGTLTLVADTPTYTAPADLLEPRTPHWGIAERDRYQPWEDQYPKRLPTLHRVDVAGTKSLALSPPPTAAQIGALGAEYPYTYAITHTLSETESETTVPPEQRWLLLLRAIAEAMLALAARGVSVPVTLGAGGNNLPKNGAPASLADQFMKAFVAGCLA